MNPSVVVVGAAGMVGRSWCELLQRAGVGFIGLTRAELDLANPAALTPNALESVIPKGVEWVVNCAAYTKVDQAESDFETAARVNGEAVGALCQVAKTRGARLVHYSTDYVFAGDATSAYPVDAAVAPSNAYGRSKALGEAALRDSGVSGLLIRTSWVYAPWGANFVRTMRRLLTEKPELKVVADQRGRPTSAQALAQNTWRLCQQLSSEHALYVGHLTDAGECTWFEFATEIGLQLALPGRVVPCTTADFPTPARRPAYSVLDLSGSERRLGPLSDWRVNLEQVTAQLKASPG
jgi:dTDP-4-dehydrorhamnose reductase